ncbi:MAG: fumarylacetoacetate hydrolase family protein, partial [Firmicutes bacterium]|nr:fumarylacetoacetate hydrolase family protein [Bacillota bacterium]
MKLVTFIYKDKEYPGVLFEDKIHPIEEESSLLGFIQSGKNISDIKMGEALALSEIKLCAPIPRPAQEIICLGVNYAAHAEESARYKKESFATERKAPVFFGKRALFATAPDEPVPAHSDITQKLDYEVELAVIIGKECRNVPKERASEHIFGYTVINDVSARDLQTEHHQWYFGKSLDGFFPMGPCIVTADEISFPPELNICSKVNGELRQDANTNLLLFGIDEIISILSKGMTLSPGTIIATGTPAGVGMGFDPPRFL